MKKRDVKAVISDYLPWLLMGVAILVILMIIIFLLKDSGFSLIDKLKNLLRPNAETGKTAEVILFLIKWN